MSNKPANKIKKEEEEDQILITIDFLLLSNIQGQTNPFIEIIYSTSNIITMLC